MGAISLEEVLGSAGVAVVVSGVVSLLVARSTAKATVEAAQVTAREERAKAADEERRQCRAALVRAVEGWHIAALEDADWSVRQENAGKARGGLIEVATILGRRVRTPEFEQLIESLAARNEDDLRRAADFWPPVQQAIVTVLSRLDSAV